MNKIYYQIDHDFSNLTKLVSQFLVNYTILYWIYKFTLETKLENALENKKASGKHSAQQPSTGAAARVSWRPSTTQGPGRPSAMAA